MKGLKVEKAIITGGLPCVFDKAEGKAKWNIKNFGKYKVLVEGAGYDCVWLETQSMGGIMYAKRDIGSYQI